MTQEQTETQRQPKEHAFDIRGEDFRRIVASRSPIECPAISDEIMVGDTVRMMERDESIEDRPALTGQWAVGMVQSVRKSQRFTYFTFGLPIASATVPSPR